MLLTFMKTVLKLEWEQLILRVGHKFKWRPCFDKSAAALNGSPELENNLHSSNGSNDLEIISETCPHAGETRQSWNYISVHDDGKIFWSK